MISFQYPVKVYYKDVDQMGIVYYTRYFEYFEAARTELLASIGLDVTTIERTGIQLPVIHAECDYISGAKFEDNLIVDTFIREYPKSRLIIEYEIRMNKKRIVTGKTVHAFLSLVRSRPVRLPQIMAEKLNPYFAKVTE